jgi:hypothetical protein
MRALETITGLEGFERRGAGTDAERRAARWLADRLTATGREVLVEPFWCRPNWPLAHAWHVALALAGSLVSVPSPHAGALMLLAALVSILLDAFTGVSPGRRLTPERASQNVVAVPRISAAEAPPVRVLLTANYDAGRIGLVYRDRLRRLSGALRRATLGLSPGWLGWLSLTVIWLLVLAILRVEGHHSKLIGAIQLVPTVGLVLTLAALVELATTDPGPAAGDNGSGVAVALELARALDTAPPRHVAVELVLQGAGDSTAAGLRRHLRARRKEHTAANTIVVGIAPCSSGAPRWWSSDGPLVPLLYSRHLRGLCASIAGDEAELGAKSHSGRGTTPALTARILRRPAISIGCLNRHELVPRSHRPDDISSAIESSALDAGVQFGLMLIDEIDASLADSRQQQALTPV